MNLFYSIERNFEFAFICNPINNIDKRRPEELRPSTGPLNTTYLIGGQSCLESILVRPFFYFHYQFQKNLRSLKLQTLNAKQYLSTIERGLSTFDLPFSRIFSVESRLFFVERSKKDLNMQTCDYEGLLSGSESNVLYLDSTELNRTQQNIPAHSTNLAKWARNMIKTQGLNRANLKSNFWFKTRSRQEKQAIYYQLRKKEALKNNKNIKSRGGEKLKEAITSSILLCESFKASLFLAIEIIVLYLSHSFYFQFGFTPILAMGCAFIVEGSYTVLSASEGFKYQALRWLVFLYSAFSLCFASFSNDPALKARFETQNSLILFKERELKNLNTDLVSARKEKASLLKAQQKYFAYDKVTIGLSKLQKPLKELQERTQKINLAIKKVSLELQSLKNSIKDRRIFSFSNFLSLETKTHALMFLMLLLQIISSSFIGSSTKALKAYLRQRKPKKGIRAFSSFSLSA